MWDSSISFMLHDLLFNGLIVSLPYVKNFNFMLKVGILSVETYVFPLHTLFIVETLAFVTVNLTKTLKLI